MKFKPLAVLKRMFGGRQRNSQPELQGDKVVMQVKTLPDVLSVLPMMQADTHLIASGLVDLEERVRAIELKLGLKRRRKKGEIITPSTMKVIH